MRNFTIKIDIYRLMHYSASLKSDISEETLLMMIEKFSYYVANLYGLLLQEAIYSKRYRGRWEPLEDDNYIEYIGITPKYHILYSIKESLESVKVGHSYIVRINPNKRYEKSKLPLIRVLRAIDQGTSEFNARPIFKDIIRDLNHHIIDLWKGYLTIKRII